MYIEMSPCWFGYPHGRVTGQKTGNEGNIETEVE